MQSPVKSMEQQETREDENSSQIARVAKKVCDAIEPKVEKTHILFLCPDNSCNSQIAEGWARHLGKDVAEVRSACISAQGLNPNAVTVMKESGVDITRQASKVITPEAINWADLVVTVCENCEDADEICLLLPSQIKKIHWPVSDPAKVTGTEEEVINQFRGTRDKIHEYTGGLFKDLRHNVNRKIALGAVGLLGASVTFTLEVLGAAGAFWGATEVFYLRDATNETLFRYLSMGIGGLALTRYVAVHAISPHKQRNYLKDIEQEGNYGKIFQAFENPVPAIKTSVVSLIYKIAYNLKAPNSTSSATSIEK